MSRFVAICVALLALVAIVHAWECPKCDTNECPVPEGSCFAGMIQDRCNCCQICGRREGERCFNESLKNKLFKDQQVYEDCGENLECRLRTDLEPTDKVTQNIRAR